MTKTCNFKIDAIPPWETQNQSIGGKYRYSGHLQSYGIRKDLWIAAMKSFKRHQHRIKNKTIITLIDFRIDIRLTRLWVINLNTKMIVIKNGSELCGGVAHGKNTGFKTGPGRNFSNLPGSNKSSIGPFVTMTKEYKSGNKKKGKYRPHRLKIDGLNPGLNSNAKSRYIVFHSAWYMTKNGVKAPSEGCFVTEFSLNRKIVSTIKGGTFVFSFAGNRFMEMCT